jgi:hypothetical protein
MSIVVRRAATGALPRRWPGALLGGIAREATAGGYRRVDWTADGSNRGAQALYDRLGIPRADKVFYRLGGEDMRALAAGN